MVGLIKENAIHHCETIKGSVRYHMLENRKEDVKQIIETIGLQNQITEIRIFDKRGKIIVSSKNTNVGVSVDKDAEGCNSCHVEDKELLKQREIARIYKTTDDERLIGVMHPIYNEKQCFNCHPQSQKILGMLDVVLSLKETDAAISRNKKMLFLFFFITVLLIVAADQLSKTWIRAYPEGQTIFEAGFFQNSPCPKYRSCFWLISRPVICLTDSRLSRRWCSSLLCFSPLSSFAFL